MWIRLLLAPWWVSWIATALLTAAFVGPIWLLQRPDNDIGWPISRPVHCESTMTEQEDQHG